MHVECRRLLYFHVSSDELPLILPLTKVWFPAKFMQVTPVAITEDLKCPYVPRVLRKLVRRTSTFLSLTSRLFHFNGMFGMVW